MPAATHQRFSRGLAFQGLSTVAQSAITLVLMPLVIKQAGAAPYGAYVVLSSIITLVTSFCTLGAGFSCRRALPSAPDAATRTALFIPNASFQLLTATASGLLLAAGLPWLNRQVFHGEISIQTTTVLLAVLALWANNLADDYFRYTHQIPVMAKAVVVRALLHPGLVIAAPLLSLPLTADTLIRLQAVAYLVVAAGLWWRLGREVSLGFRLAGRQSHLADIRQGFPLITAVMVENFLATADRYILAAFLAPAAVGAYAVACAVGALVLLLPRIANSALLPTLSQAVDEGRPAEAQELLRNFLQVFVMLAVPFVIGGLILGVPLLVWLGNAEVAAVARWVVPIAAVSGTLNGYAYLMFNALFVDRRTGVWFRANAAAAVVSVLLSVLLIGWFRRIELAAAATVAGYAVSFWVIRRSGSWRLHLDRVLLAKSTAAALIMALTLWAARSLAFFQPADTLRVLLQAAGGGAVYFIVLAALGGWTPAQFRRALRL